MYPLAPARDQQSILPWWLPVKKEPQSMEVEQIETITPAESPVPIEQKRTPSRNVETEDTKESPIVNDQ